jgi:hypothetical protein
LHHCRGSFLAGESGEDELTVEVVVFATCCEQVAMAAAFHDAAVVKNENLVGTDDGAEPMGDDETSAACEQFGEGALETVLGDGIDRTRGFVENENPWIGQESAGKTHELTLAERETGASFADLGGKAVG